MAKDRPGSHLPVPMQVHFLNPRRVIGIYALSPRVVMDGNML